MVDPKAKAGYNLIVDDPCMYLDERSNPQTGRRLIFQGPDGTHFELKVAMSVYRNAAEVKRLLADLIDAHNALTTI